MDIARKISEVLEIPPEAMLNIPKITVVGKERVHVENYIALLDYKKDNIRLKYQGGVIDILGKNFEIKVIGEENIVISGEIDSVKLI
ncbi:MAG: sporulation protein YqfC [Clostridia bacterium]|nr:sporulation protein YqfC [Clostridia bacterium]